jgi:ADP-heptose:LPS heptosyltransferase
MTVIDGLASSDPKRHWSTGPSALASSAPPVLVLRALGLGDALTGIPALRGIRRLWPDRTLLLATNRSLGEWLMGLGIIDGVVPVAGLTVPTDLPRLGRHVAVNLHGRGPESHRALMEGTPESLIAFDCPAAGYRSPTQWRADEHEVARWCRLITDAGGPCSPADLYLASPADLHLRSPAAMPPSTSADAHRSTRADAQATSSSGASSSMVIIHPGAASEARRWPAERWAAVARELLADGNDVVLTGAEGELCAMVAQACGARDLSGELPLEELTELVGSAQLVLSGDTGVAHLATATRTPSVTLFGPIPPALWGPAIDYDLHTVLYHGTRTGDPHGDRPNPDLLKITVPEVLRAARQLLAQPAGTRQPSP